MAMATCSGRIWRPTGSSLPRAAGRVRSLPPTGAARRGQLKTQCSASRIDDSPEDSKKYRVTVTAADRVTVATTRVHDDGAGLDAYMRLPVSHYVNIGLPGDAKLERIDDELFALAAPKLQFFNVWVQPLVKTRVVSCEDVVKISAMDCILQGSKMVTDLRLTEAIKFSVETRFTWQTNPPAISSSSEIKVLVDPPGPFSFIPTSQLEASGNSVMGVMLNVLQKTFVTELANDYNRWAVDREYRQKRAGRPAIVLSLPE